MARAFGPRGRLVVGDGAITWPGTGTVAPIQAIQVARSRDECFVNENRTVFRRFSVKFGTGLVFVLFKEVFKHFQARGLLSSRFLCRCQVKPRTSAAHLPLQSFQYRSQYGPRRAVDLQRRR